MLPYAKLLLPFGKVYHGHRLNASKLEVVQNRYETVRLTAHMTFSSEIRQYDKKIIIWAIAMSPVSEPVTQSFATRKAKVT